MNAVIKGTFSKVSNKEIAHDLLRLNDFVNRFRAIERSIHFKGIEGRERNGEHAFQLGFIGKQINLRAGLGLNNELIGDLADAPDLVEVYADDTPMFPDVFRGEDDQPNHEDKRDREEAAYRKIHEDFGDTFSFVANIRTYLDQSIPEAVFISSPSTTESRDLGLASTEVMAVSSTGQMAVMRDFRLSANAFTHIGTLAQLSIGADAPRDLLDKVECADWNSDGSQLAVVHVTGGKSRLEYPIGKALYETAGWISNLRFSPKGDRLAFIDHPLLGDDGGTVSVVDLAGKKSDLTERWASAIGLAWSPSGDEVWFTATASGFSRSLRGVTLSGKERELLSAPGTLTLHDVGAGGRALISRDALRAGLIGLAPGETKERDLSWQDWTVPSAISGDGKIILFTEAGEAGGGEYAVFIRDTNGGPAVRLGQGSSRDLSDDGKWAVVLRQNMSPPDFMMLPTGVGQPRTISTGKIVPNRGHLMPGAKELMFDGHEEGHASRVYVMNVDGGPAKPLTPEGFNLPRGGLLSPDGKRLLVVSADGVAVVAADGGEPQLVRGSQPGELAIGWASDGHSIFVGTRGDTTCAVSRLDTSTGARTPPKSYGPTDVAGVVAVSCPNFAADEVHYVLGYTRSLSDLFLVEHLK